MATSSMLKAQGLRTFKNFLSSIPEGSLLEAINTIIDRDGIIEPRRGIKVLSNLGGVTKQLLNYKDRILAHYDDVIAFQKDEDGDTFDVLKAKIDFTASNGSDTITALNHNLNIDDTINFIIINTASGSPVINTSTTYFVVDKTQNSIKISLLLDGSPIVFDATYSGTFKYEYPFPEVDANLRIKGIELNRNFYVTTNNGIKKISSLDDYFVSNAGGVTALDVDLSLDLSTGSGFFGPLYTEDDLPALISTDVEVAYRITWATIDINGNLIEGVPSPRAVLQNNTGTYRNVNLAFIVPNEITSDYFFRVYRTEVGPLDNGLGGSGDEMKLVFEAPFSSAATTSVNNYNYDSVNNLITLTDAQPNDLRNTGLPLYTNEISGEGILQANNRPPVAKDISIYKSTAFFANTRTVHKKSLTFFGFDGVETFTVTSLSNTDPTVIDLGTAHGIIVGDFIGLAGTSDIDGQYEVTAVTTNTITINADSTLTTMLLGNAEVAKSHFDIITNRDTVDEQIRRYFIIGRPELYDLTITDTKAAFNENSYIYLNSYDDKIKYVFWVDKGTGTAPIISGRVSVKVDLSDVAIVTQDEVAAKFKEVLEATGDFIADQVGPVLNIATATSGAIDDMTVPFVSVAPAFGGTLVKTQDGFGENSTYNFVRFSSYSSPAQRIEDTSRSLVSVINKDTLSEVYAQYTSSVNDLPGNFYLESKRNNDKKFEIKANNDIFGKLFNPNITDYVASENDESPNSLYFSKYQQPEAVPSVNRIDIGPKDKAILRILGLRDSLFILKEEGIYRLTGENSTNFNVALFDNSATITAPDTAVILNNQIYCLTSQGVATISETGVGIISRDIEDVFNKITSPAFQNNYKKLSFAVSYEADRAYIIFVPNDPIDMAATQAYRYNTFTQTWTNWDKAATCGIVEFANNKLYLGPDDISAIEVERKTLTSRDYADREYTRIITSYDFGNTYIDTVANIEKGDMLTQEQFLTINQYNRLVKKLKSDPSVNTAPEVIALTTITTPGTDLINLILNLTTLLQTIDSTYNITYNLNSATDFNPTTDVITSTGHGLVNGDSLYFVTGSTGLPSQFITNKSYYVVNVTTNTFKLSLTKGGSAINFTAPSVGTATLSKQYFYSGNSDFATIQFEYNTLTNKMNLSSSFFFADYETSSGSVILDLLVDSVNTNLNIAYPVINVMYTLGKVTHYKAIKSSVIWAPIALGDPSIGKHIREATMLVETNSLARITLGYASDLSGNFEDILFGLNGDGGWGDFIVSNVAWGGSGISYPVRTLIPRQKQRCRYIKSRMKHSDAFFKYSILGISYTYEPTSERFYR